MIFCQCDNLSKEVYLIFSEEDRQNYLDWLLSNQQDTDYEYDEENPIKSNNHLFPRQLEHERWACIPDNEMF